MNLHKIKLFFMALNNTLLVKYNIIYYLYFD